MKTGTGTAPGAWRRAAGRLLAAWLIAQILFIAALAASPSLHRALHHDADNDDHECAVTLFIHGQVSTTATVMVVAAIAAFFGGARLLSDSRVFAPAVYRFSSSRGPPALICR